MAERPRVALLIETSLASGREILKGIARYLREHSSWSLYHEPHGLTDAAPSWLRHWRGDGIIARIQTPAMAEVIRASRIPVVDVLGVVPQLPFPLVHVDNCAIAQMAAGHLMERGLTQFCYLGLQDENWSDERYAEFVRAVARAPSQVPRFELPRDVLRRRPWENVENELAAWIARLPKPVGAMVCSDQRGAQFLEACRRARVMVPDEVAVISVDNDEPLCEVCDPPLSSIQANHAAVGYQAAACLETLMAGRPLKAPTPVKPEQVVSRLSTDMLAIEDASIAGALRLIRDRACEGLHVDEIARRVGLSRSVLQRRFQALLKRTVHQEILAAKIKRAQELLLHSELTLAVVAERAGFRHQEYMGAVFKARVGKTPGEVRAGRSR